MTTPSIEAQINRAIQLFDALPPDDSLRHEITQLASIAEIAGGLTLTLGDGGPRGVSGHALRGSKDAAHAYIAQRIRFKHGAETSPVSPSAPEDVATPPRSSVDTHPATGIRVEESQLEPRREGYERAQIMADYLILNGALRDDNVVGDVNESEFVEILRSEALAFANGPKIYALVSRENPNEFYLKMHLDTFYGEEVTYFGDANQPFDASILPNE